MAKVVAEGDCANVSRERLGRTVYQTVVLVIQRGTCHYMLVFKKHRGEGIVCFSLGGYTWSRAQTVDASLGAYSRKKNRACRSRYSSSFAYFASQDAVWNACIHLKYVECPDDRYFAQLRRMVIQADVERHAYERVPYLFGISLPSRRHIFYVQLTTIGGGGLVAGHQSLDFRWL